MKKLILLIISIFIFSFANAANPEKEYKKLISKLDVAEEARAFAVFVFRVGNYH